MPAASFKDDAQLVKFANDWLEVMARFTRKNVVCCLTATPNGETAWFPALMESCAFLDLLSSLYKGKDGASNADVKSYAHRFLDSRVYRPEKLDLLWVGICHKIAHQAHPYYVIDSSRDSRIHHLAPMRVTWTVSSGGVRPSLKLVRDGPRNISTVKPMVPWDVSYDHRLTVKPLRLQQDFRDSLYGPKGYLKWLERSKNKKGRSNFAKGIVRFFPP